MLAIKQTEIIQNVKDSSFGSLHVKYRFVQLVSEEKVSKSDYTEGGLNNVTIEKKSNKETLQSMVHKWCAHKKHIDFTK